MANVVKGLIGLAALGFILAVVVALLKAPILGITAEAFSRASNNLALIAIALGLAFKQGAAGT